MLSPVIRGMEHRPAIVEPSFTHQLIRESVGASAAAAGFSFRIVVPRSSAWVRVHGFAPLVAGPCQALFLGPDDRIDRSALADDLFLADAIQVPRQLVSELHRQGDARGTAMPGERFPMPWARLTPDQYLGLRIALRQDDPAQRESALSAWALWVLRSASADWRKRPVPTQSSAHAAGERGRFALAQAVAAHIETHWQRNVSLDELAETFQLSPFHLLRAFRRAMALTPHQYLLQLRLRRSLDLIEAGRTRIVDAALTLGFCSHGHFSTAFRNVFGMTPIDFSGYRRCHAEAAPRLLGGSA